MSKLDVFSSFQPLSIDLSKEADDDKDTIEIEGIATTEHEDTAGEIILQEGLDWSYCLKNGSFNYDHSNEPKFIVGAPQSVRKLTYNGKAATSIKGILYAGKQIVKDLIENFKAMKSAGDIRKLGFSIEGQVLQRDNKNPNIITRAKVLNVSLTHNPCNTEATVAMVKSILANIEEEETKDMEKSYSYTDEDLDKMSSKELVDYIRFLEGLKKEEEPEEEAVEDSECECGDCPECNKELDKQSDMSAIQPQDLEDDVIASSDMNIGYEEEPEDLELEDQQDVLSREDIKALVLEMLKMDLPIEKVIEKLKEYVK